MLNRLFIIIGLVAILAIGAAFVVPSFIPWGEYRGRLAEIAGEVLGAPVRIEGDVAFTLLPQPKLEFSGVSAGPEEAPTLTIERVEAEFSLIDFLRDRYNVTRLVLDHPAVRLEVDANGALSAGVALAQAVDSNVSVANATLAGGTVTLADARSGTDYVASGIAGDLRIEALRGPLSFQGTGTHDGRNYAVRLTTGALDPDDGTSLALSLRPTDDRFVLSAEGTIEAGPAPGFRGTMTWRQPPARTVGQAPVDAGQGDLVMTSQVAATTSRVLLTDYVVIPDENRAATRLQGAAEISLGAAMAFNAVISGGVLALPPRDATAEQAVEPYEILRLLRELPVPATPGIPGTVGVDLAEVDLRAFALRNVRLDARATESGWHISRLTGVLPGEATVTLAGDVDTRTGKPEFAGNLSLRAQRLDALSTLWRGLAEGNPLFGMPGGLSARLNLVGETLSVSDASLDLDGVGIPFSAQIGLGNNRDLHLTADAGELDATRSAALVALLPDLNSDAAFAVSFPKGEFELSARRAFIGGLDGHDLVGRGSWDGGVLVVDEASAADLGGARFNTTLTAFGSMLKPELSGTATIAVDSPDAPVLERLYAALGTPEGVSTFLRPSLPAKLRLTLDAPNGDGAQSLKLIGTAGSSDVTADAQLQAGFLRALAGSLQLHADIRAAEAADLTRQLGLAESELFAAGTPGHLVVRIDGNVANSLETTLRLSSGADSIGFSGNVVVTNPAAYSGRGALKLALADPSALAELAGAGGLSLPPVSATTSVVFDGPGDIALQDLTGTSGGQPFSGQLALAQRGDVLDLSGALELETVDVAGLVAAAVGPAALLPGTGIWPDGPLAIGDSLRTSTGRIAVTAPKLALGGDSIGTGAHLDFLWDAKSIRLRNVGADIGGGAISADLSVCCAGTQTARQVTGRYTLSGIALDAIVPPAVASALDGRLDARGRIEGTGESIAELLSAMSGEGTFTLSGLEIARFDPRAPAAVSGIEDIFEVQPEEVIGLIEERLDDGPFISPQVTGTYTIAGGTLRSPNLAIEGAGGRLFGSGSLRLADLGLSGSYSLTPTAIAPASATEGTTGQIVARLGGTLLAPERTFDVSALVDAIMVRAYEAEVARLEQLRAEEEARRQAEAEDAARLAAEEAERKAQEEAAKAAEDEAARRAVSEEAARKAAEDAASRPVDIGFGN